MLRLYLNLTLLIAASVGPCYAQEDLEPASVDSAGLAIYHEQYCGVCHTLEAASTRGVFGPTHEGIGSTAQRRTEDPDYTGAAETAEEYLRESIVSAQVYFAPGYGGGRYAMPSFTNLDEQQLDALVSFLLHQIKDEQAEAE